MATTDAVVAKAHGVATVKETDGTPYRRGTQETKEPAAVSWQDVTPAQSASGVSSNRRLEVMQTLGALRSQAAELRRGIRLARADSDPELLQATLDDIDRFEAMLYETSAQKQREDKMWARLESLAGALLDS